MLKKLYDKMKIESQKKFEDRKIVFGEGFSDKPQIMLIGEAPGANEEKEGRPFVGSAGKNLNEFLELINLKRENIYISNVVKLRPFKLSEKTNKPVNRPPNKEELDFFIPYLLKEIEIISPQIVVTLGNTSLRAVYEAKASIGDVHGQLIDMENYKLFPLYHPASIIYNRSLKDTYTNDVLELAKVISE